MTPSSPAAVLVVGHPEDCQLEELLLVAPQCGPGGGGLIRDYLKNQASMPSKEGTLTGVSQAYPAGVS